MNYSEQLHPIHDAFDIGCAVVPHPSLLAAGAGVGHIAAAQVNVLGTVPALEE
eukprot:COSAG03_NODE_17885_length_366_cov_0.779026_1_plen_53_part_01